MEVTGGDVAATGPSSGDVKNAQQRWRLHKLTGETKRGFRESIGAVGTIIKNRISRRGKKIIEISTTRRIRGEKKGKREEGIIGERAVPGKEAR